MGRCVARWPTPAPGDRIAVIAARTGGVLVALRCDEPAACHKPLAVLIPPVAAGSNDWLKRAFAALADRPDRYVATLSRTARSADDAVLVWDAGSLRVESVFAGRPEGLFEITLTPLACPSEGRCADAPVTTTLVWSPRTPAPTVDLQQGGLFELALRRLGDTATLPPERNWVLAVTLADEVAARKRLRAATALAEGWGGAVDADARRAFTRAVLATPSP